MHALVVCVSFLCSLSCVPTCVPFFFCMQLCIPIQVKYNTEGFLEKNRDTLSHDITLLLRSSGNDLVSALFKAEVSARGSFVVRKGGAGGEHIHVVSAAL